MSQWLQEEKKKAEKYKAVPAKRSFADILSRIIVPSGKNRPKLPFATKCVEALRLSPEELTQFDTEMTGKPLVYIENGKHYDNSISITEHYLKAAFTYTRQIDYGVFRLTDIAMTYCEVSKNPVIFKPQGRIYDIFLLNAGGKRMGGVSFENEQDLKTFNDALEQYAPHIRLNVRSDEIQITK